MVLISAAKPNPFFQVEPDFGPKIQVESVGLALRVKNRSNWVRLASNRVQIRVQPYNVLNKPNNHVWVGLGHQDQNLGQVRSGWAHRVKIRAQLGQVSRVHLAARAQMSKQRCHLSIVLYHYYLQQDFSQTKK